MAAVLRATGITFNVDAFLANCGWHTTAIFHCGDARLKAQPDGPKREASGMNVTISEAKFDDLPAQIQDAILFLKQWRDEVRRLVNFPGVSNVVIDFGIVQRDSYTQSDKFPADLVREAGACGIALELSRYPVN